MVPEVSILAESAGEGNIVYRYFDILSPGGLVPVQLLNN